MRQLFNHRTTIERERHRRIKLTVAAYAYEVLSRSIMSDAEFDSMCNAVDLSIDTGRLDGWWRANFQPHTGQWIHAHPELEKVRNTYERYYKTPAH